jgi:hypothetical protein
MRLRYLLSALLFAYPLGAIAAPAGRPVPVFRPVEARPTPLSAGRALADPAACPVGVPGPAAYTVSYVIPGDDQYYTLLNPEGCECGSLGYVLSAAHILLEFSYGYGTPVRVGVVRADLSDPECPVPLPGQYVVPPLEYELAAPDGGVYDVALPLAPSACLTGKVFLEITFTEWGFSYEAPSLLLAASCEPCASYNYYPGADYDLCTFGFEGNPIMYADATCCLAVPARRGSWGELKTHYR